MKANELIKLVEEEDYASMDDPGSAIKKEYDVNAQGTITSPGKFEGEQYYIVYYYDVGMNGMADEDDGQNWLFTLGPEDYKKFPELKGHKNIIISGSDQGFEYAELDGEMPEVDYDEDPDQD